MARSADFQICGVPNQAGGESVPASRHGFITEGKTAPGDTRPTGRLGSLRYGLLWAMMTLSLQAAVLSEDFSSNPFSRGWRVHGEGSLFSWNAASGVVDVTWDSSRSNSFFYLPLGTILGRHDEFSVAFDLQLAEVQAGVNPAKPSTFQLAIGFLNLINVTNAGFFRGNNFTAPNLVEFDFFPDTGFGPTVWPSVSSTNSAFNYNGPGDYTLLDLPLNVRMRITMSYSAVQQRLSASILTNGVPLGVLNAVPLSGSFTDFRVGTFAVGSYNDAGQDPQYGGSLLARGWVDNVELTLPPRPVEHLWGEVVSNQWHASFTSRNYWVYWLQRSTNLTQWSTISVPTAGTGGSLTLVDTNASSTWGRAFYRIDAIRP